MLYMWGITDACGYADERAAFHVVLAHRGDSGGAGGIRELVGNSRRCLGFHPHPSLLKDVIRKIKAQFGADQPLSLLNEIRLMLEYGNLLQQRDDAIKTTFDLFFVIPQASIRSGIGQRMLPVRDRQ